MARLWDRPTGELMVLMVAITVCGSILAAGAAITVLAFIHPEADITVWITRITGLLNTMVGLLAGFLAGKTDTTRRRDDDDQ